jgi:hypothetical protein
MALLQCKLFQTPQAVLDRLEDCLLNDEDHITPGNIGEHVRKIQIALNQLSEGIGRENFELKEDGIYGPKTAAAVQAYKNAPQRRITQPFQTTADNIVGKRTIQSLDDEMVVLENEEDGIGLDPFVSLTFDGAPHDHSTCPRTGTTLGPDGRCQHFGTPVSPQGLALRVAKGVRPRKINLGGEGETQYLGFEDFVPNLGEIGPPRPLTSTLPDHCATDICLRDSPISKDASVEKGKQEILRIAAPGCRLTFCGDLGQFRTTLLTMGQVIHHVVAPDARFPGSKDAEILVLVIR